MASRKMRPLLLHHYEITLQKKYKNYVTPLFQMKAFPSYVYKLADQDKKIGRIRYNQQNAHIYNKYVCLYNRNSSNARARTLNNIRRQAILDVIDKYGKKYTLYTFELSIINKFVDQSQLISQIQNILTKPENQQNIKTSFNSQSGLSLLQSMIPLNLQVWKSQICRRLGIQQLSSMKSIQNSYSQIEMFNIYKVRFSKNREAFISDMIDFEKMLLKFNFINFFHQCSSNNQYTAKKYCERFIKSLKWRSKETEEYLLLLIRNMNFRKFLILIHNFPTIAKQYESFTQRQKQSLR